MSKDNKSKLRVKSNLEAASPKERKKICGLLGTQLWCLIRGVNHQKESFIESLLFNGAETK